MLIRTTRKRNAKCERKTETQGFLCACMHVHTGGNDSKTSTGSKPPGPSLFRRSSSSRLQKNKKMKEKKANALLRKKKNIALTRKKRTTALPAGISIAVWPHLYTGSVLPSYSNWLSNGLVAAMKLNENHKKAIPCLPLPLSASRSAWTTTTTTTTTTTKKKTNNLQTN